MAILFGGGGEVGPGAWVCVPMREHRPGLPFAQQSWDAMIGKSLSDAAVTSADLRVGLGAVCHLTSVF